MEAELELAIIDYHYLLKEFEHCKKYKLVVPHPHIKTLQGLLTTGKKNISLSKISEILEYLEKNEIIIVENSLPHLDINTKGIKPKTCRFARYILAAKKKYPDIKVISDSRETKFLLKQLGIPVSQK